MRFACFYFAYDIKYLWKEGFFHLIFSLLRCSNCKKEAAIKVLYLNHVARFLVESLQNFIIKLCSFYVFNSCFIIKMFWNFLSGVDNGDDLSEILLKNIYNRIKTNELTTMDDHMTSVLQVNATSHALLWENEFNVAECIFFFFFLYVIILLSI